MKRAKRNSSKLDIAMAALAAGSVAFAVFAMPNPIFEGAVASTGLAMIIEAAQPPLGATARFGAVAAAATATFALVWLVLRALSRKAPAPKREPKIAEIDVAAPKIRRADAHPDAPARRPIFAGLDLGEPIEQEAEREPSFAPVAEEEEEQPVAEADYPRFTPVEEPEATEEAELSEEQPTFEQDSIPHRMQRLELGLLRRERKPEAAETADSPWPHQAPAQQERIDERLRGAIADLQKLARSS